MVGVSDSEMKWNGYLLYKREKNNLKLMKILRCTMKFISQFDSISYSSVRFSWAQETFRVPSYNINVSSIATNFNIFIFSYPLDSGSQMVLIYDSLSDASRKWFSSEEYQQLICVHEKSRRKNLIDILNEIWMNQLFISDNEMLYSCIRCKNLTESKQR